MSLTLHNLGNIEKTIAKFYIFCLPLRMIAPLSWLNTFLHGAAVNFDFVIGAIGIMTYIFVNKGEFVFEEDKSSNLFGTFVKTVFLLNCSSLFMASAIQLIYGNYAGESAFSGIFGMVMYYFHYIFIIAYNRRVFHVLNQGEIIKILRIVCTLLLILGYYQMIVLIFGNPYRQIIETLDVFKILMPDSNMWKLSLTGSEGASAGTILAVLVLPFLMASFIKRKSKWYIVQLLLWIPILMYMNSTSAYFMVIADIIAFAVICYQNASKKYLLSYVIFVFFIALVVLLICDGESLLRRILPDDVSYLILDKLFDRSNGSTVSRTVPIITNWRIFIKYPILGCGNGLQGYFYTTYFPDWARNVAGSDVMMFYETATHTIVNGGIFFFGYLSGYGLVGIIAIVNMIKKLIVE
jgi:hypothetical protein